jgi:hypothetical protein
MTSHKNSVFQKIENDFRVHLEIIKNKINYTTDKTGFFAAGWNGSRCALETPIRNTSHLALAFAVGGIVFKDEAFLKCSEVLINWLTKDCPFEKNGYYTNRFKPGQDSCNGVIGPAWLIFSLVKCGKILNLNPPLGIADQIYQQNRFNKLEKLWHRYDPETKNFSIDYTIDHQIFFAAAASEIGDVEKVKWFLDNIEKSGLKIRECGRIHHILFSKYSIRNRLNLLRYAKTERSNVHYINELEDGYHHYTLFVLALIYKKSSNHTFFHSSNFQRALRYLDSNWAERIKINQYAYSYNAPGFEIPLILKQFPKLSGLSTNDILVIYQKQLEFIRVKNENQLVVDSVDPNNLISRIYELACWFDVNEENSRGSVVY